MSAPEPEQHPTWQAIEPAAGTLTSERRAYAPGEHAIELSKAISAKRTADALDRLVGIFGPDNSTDITSLIYYLTTAIERKNG